MLPAHVRLVRKFFAWLYAEALCERIFSGAGLTSSKKRKRMDTDNLAAAVLCTDNERNFPVEASELKAKYNTK